MKRRKFIFAVFAATTVVTIPVINYRCRNSTTGDPLTRPDILARFCDEKTIREIGILYRSGVPGENRKEKLKDIILRDYSGRQIPASGNLEVSDWIEKKIQQDFEMGRTVIVNGWVLSETEARQCALLSLD